jgi:hypothetical protein
MRPTGALLDCKNMSPGYATGVRQMRRFEATGKTGEKTQQTWRELRAKYL